ncbi:choline dehydrogenase 7 [Cichlidogyrus casuarinus]|uniref:Choline dehydrogenase 7 n=1 Tax=Cichlidogyrus casuarinus TaxID=1844966 RepID=A0ABD2QKD5_9PLAT
MLREGIPITYTNAGTSDFTAREIRVDLITEERATRTLQRMDLLTRIRCDVLVHPQLKSRLELCEKSTELPDWWIIGRHDLEVLLGVAKHGLARTETNLVADAELSFHRIAHHISDYLANDPKALASLQAAGPGLNEETFVRKNSLMASASEAARHAANQIMIEDGLPVPFPEEPTPTPKEEKPEEEEEKLKKEAPEKEEVKTTEEENKEPETELGKQPPEWSAKFASSMALSWPKDRVLQTRIEYVVTCIETGKWPTSKRLCLGLYDDPDSRPQSTAAADLAESKRSAPDDKVAATLALYAEQESVLNAQQEQLLSLLQAAAFAQASGSDQAQTANLVETLMTQMVQLKTMQVRKLDQRRLRP